MTITQRDELLNLLQKTKEFLMEHLVPGRQMHWTSN